jgi:NTE family protein
LDWRDGVATDFVEQVVLPIREFSEHTIDIPAITAGAMLPRVRISDMVARTYRDHLYGDATLQDLPDEQHGAPRFTINATNVQTGAIWRFSRPYMADWRVGRVDSPTTSLALAVAASSAFPPVLSPVRLRLESGQVKPTDGADLHRPPFTTDVVLADGGVYDNLGIETVWKRCRTVLVSDGGGQMEPDAEPASNWGRQALRIDALIDNQVRTLRKRQIVGSLQLGVRQGAYWRTRGNIDKYPARGKLPCPRERTLELARTPTRLTKLDGALQERLINWGYALCDAAIRGFVEPDLHEPPVAFPYEVGV